MVGWQCLVGPESWAVLDVVSWCTQWHVVAPWSPAIYRLEEIG